MKSSCSKAAALTIQNRGKPIILTPLVIFGEMKDTLWRKPHGIAVKMIKADSCGESFDALNSIQTEGALNIFIRADPNLCSCIELMYQYKLAKRVKLSTFP
jgi:hypothetical protein